jgi:ribosomal protein S24E
MTLKILEEKNNQLFKRKEIKAVIISEITPSRNSILELLSKKFDTPAENVKIKGIRGNFGSSNFSIEANIYASKEEKDIIELKKKKETRPNEVELKKKEGAEGAAAKKETVAEAAVSV